MVGSAAVKALLIHHKGAGRGAVSRKALVAAIEAQGFNPDCLARKQADAEAIAAARPDLVAVAGGDGTVAAIVRALPDRSVPLALVPTGTANNIARSLGICSDPEEAIKQWDMKRRRRLDVGRAEGPWGCRRFVEGVGFGAYAESLRAVTECEDEGEDESKCPDGEEALRAALRDAAPLPLEIALDGEPLRADMLLLEIMNVPLSGPRIAFAPDARPGDGLLHLSFLPASRREAMLRWLASREGDPPVEQRTGREVKVTGGGIAMRIDDEGCELDSKAELTIALETEPVQVLAPPEAPALTG